MFLLPNDSIGPYQILNLIGTGTTGIVYQVIHQNSKEERAIKILSKEITDSAHEELVARYKQEAQVVGSLTHPGLLSVYDFGEHQDMPYIVMEYRCAPTLNQQIKNGPVPPQESIQIVDQIADTLQFVHTHGIVHRDIKPSNILYDEHGNTTIIDFGISRLRGSSLTRAGTIMGAIGYCAPEQIRASSPVDNRADLFSLGVLFYVLLTNCKPFPTTSMNAFTKAVLDQEPVPPSFLIPGLSKEIDEIEAKLLAKNPKKRYANAKALRNDLQQILPSLQKAI